MSKTRVIKGLIRHLGEEVIIKYNLGRNKCETYRAKIVRLYNHVFTVDDGMILRCFSYSDIIMKNIKIYLIAN